MIIPHRQLSPAALRGVLEEIVTRDGTELSDAGDKIDQAMRQLEKGRLVLSYDPQTHTCQLANPDHIPPS